MSKKNKNKKTVPQKQASAKDNSGKGSKFGQIKKVASTRKPDRPVVHGQMTITCES